MLSGWDRAVIAQAYGFGLRQVADDAALVDGWRDPLDDLLSELRQRHHWPAVAAYRYLRTVRRALRGQQPN
ncbi:MAG: hypothetical protein M3069_27330 [Chloroflexota bacterium]|nr:hypothetical protein [Chloroflexota bacterium]